MSILIYEPDLLVCFDISETLSDAFPQCRIDVLEQFDVGRMVDRINEIAVAVLSVTQEQVYQFLPELRNLQEWFPVVLIVDDAPRLTPAPGGLAFLSRPFSSEKLLETVSAALFARQ